MKHKKVMCFLIAIICIILLTLCVLLSMPSNALSIRAQRQSALHEAAELLRAAGFEDDSAAIRALSAAWWAEEVQDSNPYTDDDILALAQMAKGEYFLCDTPEQKQQCAAVMWVACWRSMETGMTIRETVSAPQQFHGYSSKNAPSEGLMEMSEDVLIRFHAILKGADPQTVGCVIPQSYKWFYGNGRINIFRNAYIGGQTWDWSWGNPYEGD